MARVKKKNKISVEKMDQGTLAFLKMVADFSIEHNEARELFKISNNRYRQLREQGFFKAINEKGSKRVVLGKVGNQALKYHGIEFRYKRAGFRHDQKLIKVVFDDYIKISDCPIKMMMTYQNAAEITMNFQNDVKSLQSQGINVSLPDGGFLVGRSYEFIEVISRNYSRAEIQSKENFANYFDEVGRTSIYKS